jgi:hypothetical protein
MLPGCAEETIVESRWCCLPILTRQGVTASTTWVLLGRVAGQRGCSFIGDPQPETSSLEAFTLALTAHSNQLQPSDHGYVAVTLQHPDDPPLTGGSLALPLALGMHLLERGKSWPQGVYASGGLAADGGILAVTGEDLKYRLVAGNMKMLLYPENGLHESIPDVKVVRCGRLDQAAFALDCLLEGPDPEEITHYRACLTNPRRLLNEFKSLPLGLMSLAAGREILVRIGNERHQLLPVLSHCLSDCSDDPERAAFFAHLFDVEEIAAIARQDGDEAIAAHRWCVARIACANRNGAVADSRVWIDLAQELDQTMGVRKRVDCANHAFVTTRFNRYEFRPDPPDDFSRYFEIEQQRYAIDQRANRALGAMYGTLAQNYGFCGFEYQLRFVDCVRKAEAAFGREYRPEILRLTAYRIYSLLDGAHYREAVNQLNRYLNLPAEGSPPHWVDSVLHLWRQPTEHTPFQTALVCRLLAELSANARLQPQADWCHSLARVLPGRLSHPWQLSAYNLGRLFLAADLHEQGVALLHRSVEACRSGGITMVPMALLPLAILKEFSPDEAAVDVAAAGIVHQIRSSHLLCQSHFQSLVDAATPVEALARIYIDPGRYFPFSYR